MPKEGGAGGKAKASDERRKFSKRHDPLERPTLERQIDGEELKVEQPRGNVKKAHKKRIYEKMKRAKKEDGNEDDQEDIADQKIMRQAQQHAREMRKVLGQEQQEQQEESGPAGGKEEDDDVYLSMDSDDETKSQFTSASGVDDYQNYLREEQDITEEDEAAFNMFLKPKQGKARTIADLIDEKMREQKESGDAQMGEPEYDEDGVEMQQLDPKVVEVYEGVGRWLERYKSGKLPKAMKMVPSLTNWEQIVGITNPEGWSNNAYYACTRIFASCLQDPMAQRFFNLVLLPRVIQDLKDNRRLNYHLYMSLKKACYKPAAFYKGIILPLVNSGTCTLREAMVMSSVIKKMSLPVLHSSAALMKIAMESQYSGAQSVVMRTLLDKKYALPHRVLEAVCEHFGRFRSDYRELPVKWHQALLVFAQRYKNDVAPHHKEMIKEVMRVHSHYMITPEIRRELFSLQANMPQPMMMMRAGTGGRGRGRGRGKGRGGGSGRDMMTF